MIVQNYVKDRQTGFSGENEGNWRDPPAVGRVECRQRRRHDLPEVVAGDLAWRGKEESKCKSARLGGHDASHFLSRPYAA